LKVKIIVATPEEEAKSAKDLNSLFRENYIDDAQIASAMHLSFCNAVELLEEAELLFERKRYARAFGLAVLALEELAKPPLLLNALFIEKGDQKTWQAFWKALHSHQHKQGVWSAYGKRLAGCGKSSIRHEFVYAG